MTSSTSSASVVTDEQLIADLSGVLAAVEAELAELEPRRERLSTRATQLRATIAVYKGETPEPARRARRGTGKRRPKPAASGETASA